MDNTTTPEVAQGTMDKDKVVFDLIKKELKMCIRDRGLSGSNS